MEKTTIRKNTLFKVALIESAHDIMYYIPQDRTHWSTEDIAKDFKHLLNRKIEILSKHFSIVND